jgi:hypothetical protein
MMDMSLTALVVAGLVLLAVIAVVLYVVMRVTVGRAQSVGNRPSSDRSREDAQKRAKLH